MSEIQAYKPKFPLPKRYADVKYDDVPPVIRETVEQLRESRKGLFLHGSVGTGKTHIAYAIAKEMYEERRVQVKFWNSAELMNRIRESYGNRYEGDYVDEILAFKGLLVIDDVGSERLTDWVAEQFYLIVNKKYNDMLPVIFTSNFNVGELAERVGERVASRLVEMCEVIELGGEDRRLKVTHN